ncbi:MAG TPA: four helix bundle protein [Thermococcus sp.]|nr:four helix bundle protein [Thermococcus sp.]
MTGLNSCKNSKLNKSQMFNICVKSQMSNPMSNLKSNKSKNIRHRAKVYMIFTDQLLRSATSIGANLIEAKSSSSKKDFIKFYEIALKSCNETIYWLGLLRDGKLASASKINPLIKETDEIGKMIGSSLLTLKGRK